MTTTRNQPGDEQEIFGPYVVYERLGVGGMATVHRAKEHGIEGFERIVALKRLLPHLADDASFVRSFVREAKLASMLQHANIVQLYELGRVGHVLFISMEHIQGQDVRKVLRQARKVAGPPPLPVFLSLMIQLCDALDYAHRRTDQNGEPLGLVHRDVSPSNLLITGTGHLKVIDFGIAKAQSAHLRTQTGRVKGKLAYMAPEALRVQELDARSDIFSAGVIAHELLTARPLFACKNEYQTLIRVQRAEVEPPSHYNPRCPPELDRLVLKALARDADDRWASAADLRDALEDLRTRLGMSATNREVASWMEWAFATDAPPTGAFPGLRSSTDAHGTGQFPGRSITPSESRTPLPATPGMKYVLGDATGEVEPAQMMSLPGVPAPARPAAGLEGDEAAVEFAWGGAEMETQAEPVALDDIPDVSMKMPAFGNEDTSASRGRDGARRAGTRAATHAPDGRPGSSDEADARERSRSLVGFGAGIIETHRSSTRRMLAVGAFLIAVAGAGAAYLVLPGRGDRADAPPAAGMATLRFAIEPADVVIDVQGYGRHHGSPFVLDVEAPATYQVEIHRDGYKSYVSELEVARNGTYMVQMRLQQGGSDMASLVVRSTPPGQRVAIDGKVLGARTPFDHEIGPGEHVISILDEDGNELWRHEFAAAANTHYEFHPALQQAHARQAERGERRGERRRRRDADEGDAYRDAVGTLEPRAAPVASAPGPSEPPMAPPSVRPSAITPGASSVLNGLDLAEPPAVVVPPRPPAAVAPRRAGPVTIPPGKVKKLSGELPNVSAQKDIVPSRFKTKLCIDARGTVTAVHLLTEMPRRVQYDLRRALEGWRYTPYVEDGQAVPACFTLTFHVNLGG